MIQELSVQSQVSEFILNSPMCDTHEHQMTNEALLQQEPDILVALISNYLGVE